MEITAAALQPIPTGNGGGKKSDPSADIQKLEQLKNNIEQQIRKLESNKQNKNDVKNAKDKLQKQMKEIDRQIQILRQQGVSETQPANESAQARPPRFDKYVKNEDEASGTGLYSMEQDENGNPLVVFDKPAQEKSDNKN